MTPIDTLVTECEDRNSRRRLVASLAALAAGTRAASAPELTGRGGPLYFNDPDGTLVQLSQHGDQG